MLRIIMACMAVLMLASCHTPAVRKEEGSYLVYYSDKELDELSACIVSQRQWQRARVFKTMKSNDFIVESYVGGRTIRPKHHPAWVYVWDEDSQRRVEVYYSNAILDWRRNVRLSAVQACL